MQELSEHLGIRLLNERLNDPNMQGSFESIFPKDHPKNTRFSINFFTSIGLGGITESLREYLKNMRRLTMQQQKPESSESESSGSESGSESSSAGSSSESESESSSDESDRRRSKKRRKRTWEHFQMCLLESRIWFCSNSNVLLQYACAVCDLAHDVFRCNQKAVTCKILLSKLVRGWLVVQQQRANRNLSFFPPHFSMQNKFCTRGICTIPTSHC